MTKLGVKWYVKDGMSKMSGDKVVCVKDGA